jgi:hypothetical protein
VCYVSVRKYMCVCVKVSVCIDVVEEGDQDQPCSDFCHKVKPIIGGGWILGRFGPVVDWGTKHFICHNP